MLAELERLESHLGGVADMKRQPDALLVVDLRKEAIAVREARRLGLPVVALVDTNCDPDEADLVIPGNDDAIKSCDLVIRTIADAMEAGKQKVKPEEFAAAPAEETSSAEPPRARSARTSEPAPTSHRLKSRPPSRGAAPRQSHRLRKHRLKSRSPRPRAPRRLRSRRRCRPNDRDSRSTRHGAPQAERRRDDGLQARPAGS